MKAPALFLTTTVLLCSCGKEEAPEPPIQEPVHPYAAYAETRVMPHFEPRSPARHYYLTGTVTFHLAERQVTQKAEMRLAAPDRMMFRIQQDQEHPNIFLLADQDHCWLKSGGNAYEPYDALDLWIETTMRWYVLRFPWDWAAATSTPRDASGTGLANDFVLPTTLGDLHLETDAEGFPLVASLREKTVRLSDWHMATPSGNLVPLHWDWTSEQGRREEQFERFLDQSVMVDASFRPEGAAEAAMRTLPDADSVEGTGDNLDVAELGFRYLTRVPDVDLDGVQTRVPWMVAGEARYALMDHELEGTTDFQVVEERQWLAWGTHRGVNAAEAEEYLLSVLPQLQLEADGPMWSQIDEANPKRRRGFLLPVRPKGL